VSRHAHARQVGEVQLRGAAMGHMKERDVLGGKAGWRVMRL